MSGGVATAAMGYASNLPDETHVLLANARRSPGGMVEIPDGLFSEVLSLPNDHRRAVLEVVRVAKELNPDVIHAHSSFAGLYVRLASLFPGMKQFPVVYTPHGLAFVREDVSGVKKELFRIAEKALAPMTTVFAGCSTNESDLLKEIARQGKHICVPNALPEERIASFPSWQAPEKPAVAVLGRIAPQRDPEMVIAIAQELRHTEDLQGVEVRWIGDGDSELRDRLERNGITVVGWTPAEKVPDELCKVSVMIHTARWDGFPMAVLESLAMGVPTLVSDIPALFECPDGARFKDAREAVGGIRTLIAHPNAFDWSVVKDRYNEAFQTIQLAKAYQLAIG